MRSALRLASLFLSPFLYALFAIGANLPWLSPERRATAQRHASRIRWGLVGHGRPLYATPAELRRHGQDLFEHPAPVPELGQPATRSPSDVILVDDFYDDPDAVRAHATSLEFVEYSRNWFASALETRPNPLQGKGVRLATPAIKERLADLVHQDLDDTTWATSGDGWNGAFHYKTLPRFRWEGGSFVHNHTGRDSDVQDGWSGLVYLSPEPRNGSGTTIWRDRASGKAFALDSVYDANLSRFELVLEIENRYNRLVLFYASVLHMGELGWGRGPTDGRLFQTFFFNVRPGSTRTPVALT